MGSVNPFSASKSFIKFVIPIKIENANRIITHKPRIYLLAKICFKFFIESVLPEDFLAVSFSQAIQIQRIEVVRHRIP
jgi:hypothetical protein